MPQKSKVQTALNTEELAAYPASAELPVRTVRSDFQKCGHSGDSYKLERLFAAI